MNILLGAWPSFATAIFLFLSGPAFGVGQVLSLDSRDAPPAVSRPTITALSVAEIAAVPLVVLPGLPPPSEAEVLRRNAMRETERESISYGRVPRQLGVDGRVDVPLGNAAVRVALTSVTALHMRSSWRFADDAEYTVTVFAGDDPTRPLVNRTGGGMNGDRQLVWSAITDGEHQEALITRLSPIDGPWTVTLERVAHFDLPLHPSPSDTRRKALSIGDAAYCQQDIACVLNVLSPSDQAVVLGASRGVAYMYLTKANGSTGTCTGTLLNSLSFPKPYFLTANHCTVDAVTLDTYWFYSRSGCGVGTVSPATQVTGGADFAFQSTPLDSALLVLRQLPPPAASYTGWNAASITQDTLMLAVHHPKGDLKKGSLGGVVGTNSVSTVIGGYVYPPHQLYMVDWLVGIVEPGSSGSAFFTFNPTNGGVMQVRGTLTGGNATCSGINSRTYYQRFDLIYPYIASALNAPPPASVNFQGLWWKSPANSESGWGINFAHQGDTIFATWFTYDVNEFSVWYVMTANKTAPSTYVGTLYTTTGPPFSAAPFDPAVVKATAVGTGTLNFSDANNGSFSYVIGATSQTKAITREIFGSPVPTCIFGAQPNLSLATNYQDLWWVAGGAESGWGINFTHQGNSIFATWFTYDGSGYPMWLVVTAPKTSPGNYAGTLYLTYGPPYNSVPFDPTKVEAYPVGTATITFANGNNAKLTYSIDSVYIGGGPVVQTKQLVRQVFQTPGTICN